MQSALYHGWVSHRRVTPTRNAFRYRMFMVWLDLAELPEVFAGRWLWSMAIVQGIVYGVPQDRRYQASVVDGLWFDCGAWLDQHDQGLIWSANCW